MSKVFNDADATLPLWMRLAAVALAALSAVITVGSVCWLVGVLA